MSDWVRNILSSEKTYEDVAATFALAAIPLGGVAAVTLGQWTGSMAAAWAALFALPTLCAAVAGCALVARNAIRTGQTG